jgi:hypothetical protein
MGKKANARAAWAASMQRPRGRLDVGSFKSEQRHVEEEETAATHNSSQVLGASRLLCRRSTLPRALSIPWTKCAARNAGGLLGLDYDDDDEDDDITPAAPGPQESSLSAEDMHFNVFDVFNNVCPALGAPPRYVAIVASCMLNAGPACRRTSCTGARGAGSCGDAA